MKTRIIKNAFCFFSLAAFVFHLSGCFAPQGTVANLKDPAGVNSSSASGGSGGASSGSGGSGGGAAAPVGDAEAQLRLVTGTYSALLLTEVFGPTSSTGTALITSNSISMGGPCDTYRGDCGAIGSNGQPANSQNSQLALVPSGISGRYAIVTRACDIIGKTDTAILYAVQIIRANPALTSGTAPVPTSADIDVAFNLFYKDKETDPAVNASLLSVVTDAQGLGYANFEQWRFMLVTLCSSPGWELP